jgi:dUTP pyrophosphatase
MKELRVAKIDEKAILPTRKHKDDAGMDLYCPESCFIAPNEITIVHTGIIIEIPKGFVGLIKPKGGNMHLVGSGVVDAGYQGEILIKVANTKNHSLTYEKGHPVAQLLIIPIVTPEIIEVNPEDILKIKTERGATGGIHSSILNSEVVGLSDNQPKLPYGKGWD